VLAQTDSPAARQLLERVARGGAGNPDLQLKAITYMGARNRKPENTQLLWEIYSSSNDAHVKRALLSAFASSRDKDHLLQILRTEKSTPLRMDAVSALGASGAYTELAQIYATETSPEVKERIVQSMGGNQNQAMIVELAKAEKDSKLRPRIIRQLSSTRAAATGPALATIYSSESDVQVKKAIVDTLGHQGNARLLVELARKETDSSMKREIVGRLSGMRSKEAADYMMELLK
jgi:hypothetical protein